MKSQFIRLSMALTALMAYCPISSAETLTTSNYVITITSHCGEGEVTCNNVTYNGVSKKTGKAITLKGNTKHALCEDGVTPCRFLGYEFKSGKITYLVLESASLQVIKGEGEVLINEQGEWQY